MTWPWRSWKQQIWALTRNKHWRTNIPLDGEMYCEKKKTLPYLGLDPRPLAESSVKKVITYLDVASSIFLLLLKSTYFLFLFLWNKVKTLQPRILKKNVFVKTTTDHCNGRTNAIFPQIEPDSQKKFNFFLTNQQLAWTSMKAWHYKAMLCCLATGF